MRKILLSLGLILFLYLLSFFLVSPFYEYPVGDAWSYAKVAKHFFETGKFETLRWYGQSLVAQIWWSALFLIPAGFSFSALHLSNAVLGALAIVFFYFLIRAYRFSPRECFFGTLLLVISPPFVMFSRTFHTEIPFLTFYLGAAWMYAEGYQHRSLFWLLMASLLMSLSLLVRQVGIFLPIMVFVLCQKERKHFSSVLHFILLLPFLTIACFSVWQHHYFQGTPPAHFLLGVYLLRVDQFLLQLLQIPFFLLLYFGFYLSPVLAVGSIDLILRRETYQKMFSLFLLGCALIGGSVIAFGKFQGVWMLDYLPRGFTLKGAPIFLYGLVTFFAVISAAYFLSVYYPRAIQKINTKLMGMRLGFLLCGGCILLLPFIRSGLLFMGGRLLPFVYTFFSKRIYLYQSLETWGSRLPLLYDHFVLYLLGVLGLLGLLLVGLPYLTRKWEGGAFLEPLGDAEKMFHMASLCYLIFLLWLPITNDRYFFPILPSAILFSLRAGRIVENHKPAVVFLVLVVFSFSLIRADRTLQKVGAFWKGGHQLLSERAPLETIDAGFVFNSWYLYEKRIREGAEGIDRDWRGRGWWIHQRNFQVTEHPSSEDTLLGEISYRDLFTPGEDMVYLVRKK